MHYSRQIALFLIGLVITIPFYTSSVYAATGRFSVESVNSKDNVKGNYGTYRRALNDFVEVQIRGKHLPKVTLPVANNFVIVNAGYAGNFGNCEILQVPGDINWSRCRIKTPDFDLAAGIYNYRIAFNTVTTKSDQELLTEGAVEAAKIALVCVAANAAVVIGTVGVTLVTFGFATPAAVVLAAAGFGATSEICMVSSAAAQGAIFADKDYAYRLKGATLFQDATVISDGNKPTINNFNIREELTNVDTLAIDVDVKDSACNSEKCRQLSLCSGIKNIEIFKKDNLNNLLKVDINSAPEQCSYVQTLNVPSSALSSGENYLCIKAEDNVNNGKLKTHENCDKVVIDKTPPVINSINLIDVSTGKSLKALPETGKTISVEANITTDYANMNLNDVYADVRDLGGVINLQLSCSKYDEVANTKYWLCKNSFHGNLHLEGTAHVSINVSAADDIGNDAQSRVQYFDINMDADAPGISAIKTDKCEKYLALPNTTIIALFDEQGSGLGDIYLSGVSSFFNRTDEKGNCTQEDEGWECVWSELVPIRPLSAVSLTLRGSDDAGHSFQHAVTELKTDSSAPVIDSIIFDSGTECPSTLTPIIAKVIVSDFGSDNIELQVDASSISTEEIEIDDADCIKSNETGKIMCEFEIDEIKTEHKTGNVIIKAKDCGGNEVVAQKEVEICAISSDEEPNLISSHAGTVSSISKRALNKTSIKTFVPLILDYDSSKVRVSSVDFRGCNDDSIMSSRDSYMMDTTTNAPILVLGLNSKDYGNNESINLTCKISLGVTSEGIIYTKQEAENVSVVIPLQKSTMLTIDESVEAKIGAMDDKIKHLEGRIDSWETALLTPEYICKLGESIGQLNQVTQTIKSVVFVVLQSLYLALQWTGYVEWMHGVWNFLCYWTTGTSNLIDKYIWPSGLWNPSNPGMYFKIGCMIYSCRLCDPDFMANTIGSVGAGVFASQVGTVTAQYDEQGQSIAEWQKGEFDEKQKVKTATSDMFFEDELNPYKSRYVAFGCLCMPAYVYSLKKERQITCMKKTCYEQNLENGLSVYGCDEAYSFRGCLYVEGASALKNGWSTIARWLGNIREALIMNSPGIVMGVGYRILCTQAARYLTPEFTYELVPPGACDAGLFQTELWDNIMIVGCGLGQVALNYKDLTDLGAAPYGGFWEESKNEISQEFCK